MRIAWASPPKSGAQEALLGEDHSVLLEDNPRKLDCCGTVATVCGQQSWYSSYCACTIVDIAMG